MLHQILFMMVASTPLPMPRLNIAEQMLAAGADFIDVGAVSTRPGAAALSAKKNGSV
jgi:dihydropteroate synthase